MPNAIHFVDIISRSGYNLYEGARCRALSSRSEIRVIQQRHSRELSDRFCICRALASKKKKIARFMRSQVAMFNAEQRIALENRRCWPRFHCQVERGTVRERRRRGEFSGTEGLRKMSSICALRCNTSDNRRIRARAIINSLLGYAVASVAWIMYTLHPQYYIILFTHHRAFSLHIRSKFTQTPIDTHIHTHT